MLKKLELRLSDVHDLLLIASKTLSLVMGLVGSDTRIRAGGFGITYNPSNPSGYLPIVYP